MTCPTCNLEVELNQKFISGFDAEKKYFVKHAKCAGIPDHKAKTMSQLRVDSIALFHKLKAAKV